MALVAAVAVRDESWNRVSASQAARRERCCQFISTAVSPPISHLMLSLLQYSCLIICLTMILLIVHASTAASAAQIGLEMIHGAIARDCSAARCGVEAGSR